MNRAVILGLVAIVTVAADRAVGQREVPPVTCFASENEADWVGGPCANPSLSADGRFCAYSTPCPFVAGDLGWLDDVYLHDPVRRRSIRLTIGRQQKDPDGPCGVHAVSLAADASAVAYDSTATNLVTGDTNAVSDVFVTETAGGKTVRVSVSSAGGQANGASQLAVLSGDSRSVVFASDATNLVMGDRNGRRDVFLHDRVTGQTIRVSGGAGVGESNGSSGRTGLAVSADGRFTAFDSEASNLVAGDTNGQRDIFVFDRVTGKTERVSRAVAGNADGPSRFPAISADGRHVAFASFASNLVKSDVNRLADVFVWDRVSQRMERVSRTSAGAGGDSSSGEHVVTISGDGSHVAFDSRATNLLPSYSGPNHPRVHVHDRRTGALAGRTWIGPGFATEKNSGTRGISLSHAGRHTAFNEWGRRLEVSNPYRTSYLVVHRRNPPPAAHPVGGAVTAFPGVVGSVAGVDLAAGGRFTVVAELRSMVQQVVLLDRADGRQTTLSVNAQGVAANWHCGLPRISPGGGFVAFECWGTNLVPNDKNGQPDIFLVNVASRTVKRANLGPNGVEAAQGCFNACVSSLGRYVTFESLASNITRRKDRNPGYDILLADMSTGNVTIVSRASSGAQALGHCSWARITGDGRFVVFVSEASNLVAGDTNGAPDIFLRDLKNLTTTRVSVGSGSVQADARSEFPALSDDGRYVVFTSQATNLVAGDTNGKTDIFLRDVTTGTTSRINVGVLGEQTGVDCEFPWISRNGRWITFSSSSSRLAYDDHNQHRDYFMHDRTTGGTWRLSVDDAHLPQLPLGIPVRNHAPVTDDGTVLYHGLELRIRDAACRAYPIGPTRLGAAVTLRFEAPTDAGRPYLAAMAFDYRPGIPLTYRTIPLRPDALTVTSLQAPALFPGFSGVLDVGGGATGGFRLPGHGALEGLNVYVAFVVLDPLAADGVRRISNAARVQATR